MRLRNDNRLCATSVRVRKERDGAQCSQFGLRSAHDSSVNVPGQVAITFSEPSCDGQRAHGTFRLAFRSSL